MVDFASGGEASLSNNMSTYRRRMMPHDQREQLLDELSLH